MINHFTDLLKSIICCKYETYDDLYLDCYRDRDVSGIRIPDQRNFHEILISRGDEESHSALSSIYIHRHASSGSNSTTRIPEKQAFLSSSTKYCQAVSPSPSSSSTSAASSVSSIQPVLKPCEPSQPCVTVLPPTASSTPPVESVSKPPSVLSREEAPSSKPPVFASSCTSSSSNPPPVVSLKSKSSPPPIPELSKPCQPHVTTPPPTASSKPPNEFVPSRTHSPSISYRKKAPSSKPPLFASSSTSSSSSASAASSISSNQPIPKPSEPSKVHVIVLPPTAFSELPSEFESYTHSPSVSSREHSPSSKPPIFASSSTSSSSSKSSPGVSSKAKSSPTPGSSSFEHHEGDVKAVKAKLKCVPSEESKTIYTEEDTSPTYMIPKEIQDTIMRDIVPGVLRNPLTPSTYKDYFASLLYAEDFYIEKWKNFELEDVSLQLHEASVMKQGKDRNRDAKHVKENRTFVVFEIDSVPKKRPFLLSRDFVFAKPVGERGRKFQGIIYRVKKSTQVLVEFEDSFYVKHNSKSSYHISFSFNRVCLKRAHQALEAAERPSFQNLLFPGYKHRIEYSPRSPSSHSFDMLYLDQKSAISQILGFKSSPPYLVEGPISVQYSILSRTGVLVREAVLEIYRRVENCRVLVSAPKNNTCDVLMSSLKKDIPESVMFRANAAFRDKNVVPEDIFSSCPFKNDCFTCPSLQELKGFKVVFSTFVSSFRLHHEGVKAGHFSHIFVVDASEAIEPEVMIALANFANDDTSVVVTGSPLTGTRWIRSDIAWRNGLGKSYFQRLRENALYKTLDSAYITQLQNPYQNPHR